MQIKSRGFIILLTIMSLCSYTSAYQEIIDFSDYLSYTNAFNTYDANISESELQIAYQTIQSKDCTRSEDGADYIIDPICIRQKKFPEIPFTQAIDLIRDNIEGFNYVYNTSPTEVFDYEGGLPNYKDQTAIDFLLIQDTRAHKALATYHTIEQDRIRIPKKILAQIQADAYKFYAVYNDTSMRKGCTLRNYEIALYSMDKVFLYPGQVFNFNNHITDLDYCTGRGRKDLQFYGGVCGAASQLFRSSLIVPFIHITQRQGHSEWRATYYGEDITGDDAAIYEMYKQLEIQNNGDRGLYFRTIKADNHSYLVAITPYKPEQAVRINRYRESKLRTKVTKTLYNIQNHERYPDVVEFSTRYNKRNHDKN